MKRPKSFPVFDGDKVAADLQEDVSRAVGKDCPPDTWIHIHGGDKRGADFAARVASTVLSDYDGVVCAACEAECFADGWVASIAYWGPQDVLFDLAGKIARRKSVR